MTERWTAPRAGIYQVPLGGALLAGADDLPETATELPSDAWVTTPAEEVA
jgi:hypothetical protein